MIFWSAQTMCQNTSINLENKTVTVDEQQLENIDKGLRNEQLQREEIVSLKKLIKEKDSIIKLLNQKHDRVIDKVLEYNKSIQQNQNDLTESTETQLENEKKKRKNGLYAFSYLAGNRDSLLGNYIGLQYVSEKMIYSFSFDVYTQENIVFSGGIGFKIF